MFVATAKVRNKNDKCKILMFGSSHHQQPAAADEQGSSGGNSCNQGCCLHDNIPGERVPELRVYGHVCLSLFRQASRFHTVQLHIDECKPLFMQAQGSIVELFLTHSVRDPGIAPGKPEIQ